MILDFLKWKFIYSNRSFLRAWFEFLKFGLNIFSVRILLKTFFSPWHKYWSSYPLGFNPKDAFFVFFGNMMSRVVGMILRTIFILAGIIFEIFIFFFGAFLFLVWVLWPFLVLYFLYLGLLFLF